MRIFVNMNCVFHSLSETQLQCIIHFEYSILDFKWISVDELLDFKWFSVTFRLLLLEIRTQVFKDELVQCEYLFIVLCMYVNTFTLLWWIGCVLLYIIGIYVKWIILQRGGVPWLAEAISTDYRLLVELCRAYIYVSWYCL